MDISTLILLSVLLSTLSALPVRYDQRQDGDLNVQAHLDNFVIVLIPNNGALSLLDLMQLKKDSNRNELKSTSENEKYVPPSTAIKSTSPNFPAGTSPYKVDLDKQDGGEMVPVEGEVLIAQSAPVALSKVSTKKVSSTAASSEETKSTEASFEGPVEERKKSDQVVSSAKIGTVNEKSEPLADKKDENYNNDDVKVEKNDKVPTIESKPHSPVISPKAIDFAVDVHTFLPRKTSEEEIPSIGLLPTTVRSSKSPVARLESGDVDPEKLKRLRFGLEEDCRDCHETKSRSGHVFQQDSQRLQLLRFGLSPAVD